MRLVVKSCYSYGGWYSALSFVVRFHIFFLLSSSCSSLFSYLASVPAIDYALHCFVALALPFAQSVTTIPSPLFSAVLTLCTIIDSISVPSCIGSTTSWSTSSIGRLVLSLPTSSLLRISIVVASVLSVSLSRIWLALFDLLSRALLYCLNI